MAFSPRAIVVHCSASRWGSSATIAEWHKARGWKTIGYHAVVTNGYRGPKMAYDPKYDGKIEPGRDEHTMGAHCAAEGMNRIALGACLIGLPGWGEYPTAKQKGALIHLLATWCRRYNISPDNITQHSDHDKGKPLCASLDMQEVRAQVRAALKGE